MRDRDFIQLIRMQPGFAEPWMALFAATDSFARRLIHWFEPTWINAQGHRSTIHGSCTVAELTKRRCGANSRFRNTQTKRAGHVTRPSVR